ncbi:MAG: 2-oxo acid dehydrogenase subunit E2 [Acidimicrobiales bacterium]
MANVTMPQLGETVAEGTVTRWFKAVGDEVAKGDPLFEVSTDKVDTEIPSPFAGPLTAILVGEGETVDVGTVLAVIGVADANPSTPSASTSRAARVVATPARESTRKHNAQQLSPVVRRLLDENGLNPDDITGTGPNGRLTRDDVLAAATRASAPAATAGPASPVVRRLLGDHGVDPSSVVGTGPDGRVTRRDAEAAVARHGAGDEVVPFTRIRRLTAERMVRSKATSAHTLMVREVDYENVEATRRIHAAAFRESEGFSLSYLPFNAVATVIALADFPHLNASVGDDALVVHRDIHLGIAVDLDEEGLVVPVVHDAARLGLREFAHAIRDRASRARLHELGVDDYARGTFTISNPGPFGTLLTGAIINQPQVAILSTDTVTRRPVVVEVDGVESVAIHSVGLLALTFDHRAIDGAYAARFLRRIAEIIATHDWSASL